MSGAAALLYCAGGGIGDSLVATVVAQALRERFDRVDALTLPGHRAALERCPDLHGVLVDDGGDERALAERLRERGYAACAITWATARVARVAERAKIPIRVGQARRLYSWRFTQRVVVRSEDGDVTSPWSDILLDYARALGCDAPNAIPHFTPTPEDETETNALLATLGIAGGARSTPLRSAHDDEAAFIILHATNAEATRRNIWPTQAWSALASALHAEFGVPVLVTGSDADRAIAEDIVRGTAKGAVTSVAGRLGIGAFGALARRATAFVGISTGTMHVAAAVGCPTVGIFPFQSDFPDRWAPRGARTTVVRPTYACHRGDTKENCPDYACIANLNVPRILAETRALLADRRD